ncbi:MAG TPA: SgcJ/EcaC family oxidoreductase [Gammaproteobacteria bacterium]|nr:SgcJ/EcaC family oxidoreductase [Gammaproteobacteria bacterium]
MPSIFLDQPECVPAVFVEAWNERDPDKLASIFEADAEFVNVTGLWWHDRESIRKAHAYGLERIFNRSELRLVATRVKWLDDSIAVVHAKMTLTGQTPVGEVEQPQTRQNIFSFVVRRTPLGWRCVSAHNTDVIPGKETNIVDEQGQLSSVSYRNPQR